MKSALLNRPLARSPSTSIRQPTKVVIPEHTVDSHAHVIGAPPDYPYVPERSFTPTPAGVEEYLAMLDAYGIDFGVLVQISVHGTDNRLMLEALRIHRTRLRGIAVVPLGLKDREYRELADAGVCGLRLNVMFAGGFGLSAVEEYGALAAELGWHLQFLVKADSLEEVSPSLARLRVPYVVDHMGYVDMKEDLGNPGFQTLLGLVQDGAWVKLTGGYRLTNDAPPYPQTWPFARALFDAAPARCLWGTDWPHSNFDGHPFEIADFIDSVGEWLPSPADRYRLFVENPGRLFGFGSVTASKHEADRSGR